MVMLHILQGQLFHLTTCSDYSATNALKPRAVEAGPQAVRFGKYADEERRDQEGDDEIGLRRLVVEGPGEHDHGPAEHNHGPGEHNHGPGEHDHGPAEHEGHNHGPGGLKGVDPGTEGHEEHDHGTEGHEEHDHGHGGPRCKDGKKVETEDAHEEDFQSNAAAAFGIVTGAGLSTCIGALAVYIPSLVKLANTRVLAAGLGLSAGVMLYVSLVDIFHTGIHSFQSECFCHKDAFLYGTLSFFAGVLLMFLIDFIVHWLSPDAGHCHGEVMHEATRRHKAHEQAAEGQTSPQDADAISRKSPTLTAVVSTAASSEPDAEELPGIQLDADTSIAEGEIVTPAEPFDETRRLSQASDRNECSVVKASSSPFDKVHSVEKQRDCTALTEMGIVSAIAIALHNFPEGLTTFIATAKSLQVGVSFAIAIMLHNIPEGLCVAIPIFYATGNRHKAFFWAFFSGMTEPLAAGIAWGSLSAVKNVSGAVFGVLYGITAGMMTTIIIKELIPMAHRYDPHNHVTTYFVVLGMVIMGMSLVLFEFSGGHSHDM